MSDKPKLCPFCGKESLEHTSEDPELPIEIDELNEAECEVARYSCFVCGKVFYVPLPVEEKKRSLEKFITIDPS